MKLTENDLHTARSFWDALLAQITYEGPVPALSSVGLNLLAEVLKKKQVGRFDELMPDEDVLKAKEDNTTLNDVRQLINSWFVRTLEAREFETKPTDIQELSSQFQVASQILKVCKVEQDVEVKQE